MDIPLPLYSILPDRKVFTTPQSDCLIYIMKGALHLHGFYLKFLRIQSFQSRLRQDFPAGGKRRLSFSFI